MRRLPYVLLPLVVAASAASAQSLAQRVRETDGIVQVIYPSRPTACGDGNGMIGGVLGRSTYYSGTNAYTRSDGFASRACVPGPARAVATVVGGEVTRIRTFVGPVPPARSDTRTINASAKEAADWLGDVVVHNTGRSAAEAMLPLVAAEGSTPWTLLLRVTRDENRPRDVRRAAMDWLSQGVSEHLGLLDADSHSDDDEVRTQAVFVLSQRPKSESVPELLDLARSAKNPVVRKSAIFWLGQTGDARAAELYAELLGVR